MYIIPNNLDADLDQYFEQMAQAILTTIPAAKLPELLTIGIHTGGVWVAEKLHKKLALKQPLGTLNIAFYRDDFSRIGLHPKVIPSKLPFAVENRHLLLVDDVLHTGRTIRAALNEIFDYGRPDKVQLAVLIDRGEHELPIQADFIGTSISLRSGQHVKLSFVEQKLTIKIINAA